MVINVLWSATRTKDIKAARGSDPLQLTPTVRYRPITTYPLPLGVQPLQGVYVAVVGCPFLKVARASFGGV
jgi:hypothetical protein